MHLKNEIEEDSRDSKITKQKSKKTIQSYYVRIVYKD